MIDLSYYRSVVGPSSPTWQPLLEALAEELEGYAQAVGAATTARDLEALGRLRHNHRPAVTNLGLTVGDLEARLLSPDPTEAEAAARALAEVLTGAVAELRRGA